MTTDLVARAQDYVAASNDHDLPRIEQMLAPGCIYQSSGVGRHEGAAGIIAMMGDFFAGYPDVHWRPSNFRLADTGCVQFDFVIVLPKGENTGVERLHFDGAGRIVQIEVQR